MQLRAETPGPVKTDAQAFFEACEAIPLAGARILELGCGKAEATREIAQRFPRARITALEVDAVQHGRNLAITDLPNVNFAAGGAEEIPAADASQDLVVMFRSLHHVPAPLLDRALEEIRRVLVPGGHAVFVEPVFAGDYNELLRIFNDEERVRSLAFDALRRAVESRRFELVEESFFARQVRFTDFAHFERAVIGVTHTQHVLSERQLAEVRERFARHCGPQGAVFTGPMRIDVLRRP